MKNGKFFDDDEDDRVGGIPLEVWRNPDTRWLDPANGIGNFPYVAFHMLDYQLGNHGPLNMKDKTVRRKHIVEKMLYMIELDKGNVNTSFKIFEHLVPGSKPNICCADTLKLKDADLQRNFGVSTFHVVMGNPPFQADVTSKQVARGQPIFIWDTFLLKALDILLTDGFLVFITPPGWRKPETPLWQILSKDSQIHFLHILGKPAVSKLFHVSQRIDMYLVEKRKAYTNTYIIDEKNELTHINLSEWPFLPNYSYNSFANIFAPKEDGVRVIYSTAYHSSPSGKKLIEKPRMTANSEYKYPVVHNITQEGLGIRYVRDNTKGHFGVPKVLLNKNEQQYPVNDYDGKYGMTEMTFGIPISSKEEGDDIVRAINTDRFKTIIKATKWGAFITDYHMFFYFKPNFYREFSSEDGGGRRRTTRRKSRQK